MTFNAKHCMDCVNKSIVSHKAERQQKEKAMDRELLEEAKEGHRIDTSQKESSFRRRQQYYKEYKESLKE